MDAAGDYQDAISEHQVELSLSQINLDPIGEAVASRRIGECYCSMFEFEKVGTVFRRKGALLSIN